MQFEIILSLQEGSKEDKGDGEEKLDEETKKDLQDELEATKAELVVLRGEIQVLEGGKVTLNESLNSAREVFDNVRLTLFGMFGLYAFLLGFKDLQRSLSESVKTAN